MFPILIRSFYKEFRIQHGRGLSLILVFVIFPFLFERVFLLVYSTSCFGLRTSRTYNFCFDLDQFSIVLVLAHFSIFIHSSDLTLHSYSSFYLELCYCFPLRSILFVSMIDCYCFCFGSVLVVALLHHFTWKLFRRFRIVILFWFRLTFSLSFCLWLCLVCFWFFGF